MANDCRLTTLDNPYNPFEQFTLWLLFDNEKGYNTLGKQDRLAHYSDDMTEKEIDEEHDRVIDEIIKYDFLNIYQKVYRNDSKLQVEEPVGEVTR